MTPIVEEQESQVGYPETFNEAPLDDFDNGLAQLDMNEDEHLQVNSPQEQLSNVRDSFKSVVEETQYLEVELDTLARSQQVQELEMSPISCRILRPDSAPRPGDDDDIPLFTGFTRPALEEQPDWYAGFKMRAAKKPVPGSYGRPPQNESANSRTAPLESFEKSQDHDMQKGQAKPASVSMHASPIFQRVVSQTTVHTQSSSEKPAMIEHDDIPDTQPLPASTSRTISNNRTASTSGSTTQHGDQMLQARNDDVHLPIGVQNKLPKVAAYDVNAKKATGQSHHQKVYLSKQDRNPEPMPAFEDHPSSAQSLLIDTSVSEKIKSARAEGHNSGGKEVNSVVSSNMSTDTRRLRLDTKMSMESQNPVIPSRHNRAKPQTQPQEPFPEAVIAPSRRRKQTATLPDFVQLPQTANDVSEVAVPSPQVNLSDLIVPIAAQRDVVMQDANQQSSPGPLAGKIDQQVIHGNDYPESHNDVNNLITNVTQARHDIDRNLDDNSCPSSSPPRTVQHHQQGTNQGQPRAKARQGSGIISVNEHSSPAKSIVQEDDANLSHRSQVGEYRSASANSKAPRQSYINLTTYHDVQQTQSEMSPAIAVDNKDNDMVIDAEEGNTICAEHHPPTEISRVASPAEEDDQFPRPPSRQQHASRGIVRPVSRKGSKSADSSRTVSHASKAKVTKTHRSQKPATTGDGSHSYLSADVNDLRHQYQNFMASGSQICDVLADYQEQKVTLEAQLIEIAQLKTSGQKNDEQLQALQAEKLQLDEKIKKLTDSSSKYKRHINEVVKTQKFLKAQSIDIRKLETEAVEIMPVLKNREITLESLHAGIKEVRELKAFVDNLAAKQHKTLQKVTAKLTGENISLREGLRDLRRESKEFARQKKVLTSENIEKYAENQKLQQGMARLRQENLSFVDEIFRNVEYAKQLNDLLTTGEKTKGLLEQDLDRRAAELGRAQNSIEKLQVVVETQAATQKEILDLLKQIPTGILEELVKEEGVVTKVFASVKAVQAKIDEATSQISTLQSHQPEPSASLVKLIEDLFSRLQSEGKSLNEAKSEGLQSAEKLIEDVKSRIVQLQFGEKAKAQLNDQIAELKETNHNLVAEKVAVERDLQNSTKQLDEAKKDLTNCRKDLNTKSDELSAALAVSSEDPLLKLQIQGLNNTKDALENRLETANQTNSKLKEEIQTLGEAATRKEQEIKKLEGNINTAQIAIDKLSEEKATDAAAAKRKNEELRRELTQKFEIREATAKANFETEFLKLSQQNKERLAELTSAREKLRNHQEASIAAEDNTRNVLQKQKNSEAQLQSIKEELQKLRETNTGLDITVNDMNQKSKEKEAELMSVREELRHAQETAIAAGNSEQDINPKFKEKELELTSAKEDLRKVQEKGSTAGESVRKLNQQHRELKTELISAREEVQKLSHGNATLENTIKKQLEDITSLREMFSEQAAHLLRLDDRNPGRHAFEEQENGLRMARSEISDLRNQLGFINTTHMQKLGSAKEDQRYIESRILQVDVLEKERDAAESQRAAVDNQLTSLRKQLQELKTQTEALLQNNNASSYRTRGYVEEPLICSVVTPILQGSGTPRTNPFSTPNATLYESGQTSSTSRTPSTSQDVSRSMARKVLGSGSSLPSSTPRNIRPAVRRSSSSHLHMSQTTDPDSASATPQVAQTLAPQNLLRPQGSAASRAVNAVKVSKKRNRLDPGYASDEDVPLAFSGESPPVWKKPKAAVADSMKAVHTPRTEGKSVPTIQEEMRIRRNSKPSKSAMKRTVPSNAVAESSEVQQQIDTTVTKTTVSDAGRLVSSVQTNTSTVRTKSWSRGPEDFPGFVKGKPTKMTAQTLDTPARLLNVAKYSTKKGDAPTHSPPHQRAPRQAPKSQGAPGRRASLLRQQYPTSAVIPDSQDTQ